MGAIWLTRQSLIETFIDIAGYKAGLVLAEGHIVEILKESKLVDEILAFDGGRIRSEDFEAAAVFLLFKLGQTPSPSPIPASIELFHKYKRDPERLAIYQGVQEIYVAMMPTLMEGLTSGSRIDPSPFLMEVHDRFGGAGFEMAMEFIEGINRDLYRSPMAPIRETEWKDQVELSALFESEKLGSMHGRFFDQRFIEYLGANFEKIGDIHWRQFEGLTGEFFDREGFKVDVGPGRNDDGIDLRIYPREARDDAPPVILVQCKRQKAKIDKALVKSVYADVIHENAESGLIVTSSTLSPGAEALRVARGYNVQSVDRPKLCEWIEKMRSGAKEE